MSEDGRTHQFACLSSVTALSSLTHVHHMLLTGYNICWGLSGFQKSVKKVRQDIHSLLCRSRTVVNMQFPVSDRRHKEFKNLMGLVPISSVPLRYREDEIYCVSVNH
jgi:hypothetical protein